MAKRDNLLQLINSLSTSEKRYFKLFCQLQQGEKNYLLLFNAMEGKQEYVAKDIAAKLGNGKKINLSYERQYLNKMLLRALRNFHDGRTQAITMYQTLIDVELLFDKKLYDYCLQLINEAIHLVETNNLYHVGLSLYTLKLKCLMRRGDTHGLNKYTVDLQVYKESVLQMEDLHILQAKLNAYFHGQGNVNKESDIDFLNSLLQYPIIKDDYQLHNLFARILQLEIRSQLFSRLGQLQTAYDTMLQLLKTFNESGGVKQWGSQMFFAINMGLAIRALQMHKYELTLRHIDDTESLLTNKDVYVSKGLEEQIAAFGREKRMEVASEQRQFKKVLEISKSYKIALKDLVDGPKFSIIHNFYVARAFFYIGKIDEALIAIRPNVEDTYDRQRPDYLAASHALYLLIQIEFKHYRVIPHLIKSLERFVKTRKINVASTFSLIKLLKEISNTNTQPAKLKVIVNSYLKATNESNRNNEVYFELHFLLDIELWLQKYLK